MKKINILFITAAILVLGTAFITLTSSSPSSKKVEAPTCCQKKAPACDINATKNGTGELIMESMSRQFITVTPL